MQANPWIGEFRIMDSGRPIELERYLPDMLSRNEELEIHVGCDSQNKGVRTIYVNLNAYSDTAAMNTAISNALAS